MMSSRQLASLMIVNNHKLGIKALSEELMLQKLVEAGVAEETAKAATAQVFQTSVTKAQTAATQGAAVATGSLGAAMKGLWVSHPYMVIIAAVAAAVWVAVKAFNAYKDSIEDLRTSVTTLKNESESLDGQIKNTNSQIEELQKLSDQGTISLADQKELERLREVNKELKLEYDVKKKLLDIEAEQLEKKSVGEYSRTKYQGTEYTYDARGERKRYEYVDPVTAIRQHTDEIERLTQKKRELDEQFRDSAANNNAYKAYKVQVSSLNDQLNKEKNMLGEIVSEARKLRSGFTGITEEGAKIAEALDEAFRYFVGNDSISDAATDLNDIAVAAQAAALSIEDANDAIDSLQSAYTSLSGAVEEYNTKGYLTLDTLQSLLELEPEYLACLQTENGQLVLNKNAMIDLAYARIDDAEAAYLQEATNLLKTFEDQEKAASYLKDVTYDLASARLADADASWKQAIANAAVSDKGSEFDAAVEKLNAHVEKQRKLFDLARASVGTYSLSVMDGGKAAESAAKAAEEAAKKMKEAAKDAQSAIEDLIDVTVKMIKHRLEAKKSAYQDDLDRIKKQYDEEKDAIEDQIDAYKRLIDARKKALERDKDENDYQKQLAEKNKEIADIESKLLEIQNDDSADAMKKRLELQEQLAGKYSDLEDYQSDRAYDQATDLLDDEYERYELIHKEKLDNLEEEYKADEEYYERKIRLIEEALDQEGSMRIEAIDMIQERSSEYYNSLIEFCTTYGGMTRDEVIHVWDDAYKSLENFGFGEKTVYDILQYLIAATCDMCAETGNVSVAMDSVAGAAQRVEDGVNRVNDSLDTTIRKAEEAADAIDRVNDYSKYNNVKYKDLSGSGYDYSTVRITDPRTYPGFSSGARNLPGFASGGVVSSTGPAMLHGSSTRSEVVFSSMQGRKLLDFVENLPVVSSLLPKLNSVRGINGIGSLSTGLSIDGGLINIQVAGSLDESVVPSIRKIADRVVEQLNKSASNRGIRGNAKKGII